MNGLAIIALGICCGVPLGAYGGLVWVFLRGAR